MRGWKSQEICLSGFEEMPGICRGGTEPRDAYQTLVSEIMLQQTQVDRVRRASVDFVERWPDLESLAEASEEEVLGMWSGLGYYRRARMLHRLALEVVGSGEDRLPGSFAALKALPGVGDYTACSSRFVGVRSGRCR